MSIVTLGARQVYIHDILLLCYSIRMQHEVERTTVIEHKDRNLTLELWLGCVNEE